MVASPGLVCVVGLVLLGCGGRVFGIIVLFLGVFTVWLVFSWFDRNYCSVSCVVLFSSLVGLATQMSLLA